MAGSQGCRKQRSTSGVGPLGNPPWDQGCPAWPVRPTHKAFSTRKDQPYRPACTLKVTQGYLPVLTMSGQGKAVAD